MMRKYRILCEVGLVSFALFVCYCNNASAATYVTPGGDSAGNGTVPTCSPNYHTIHEPSCGEGGGGKSWRVYKISDEVIKRVTSNKTNTQILAALNHDYDKDEDADWKIVNGKYNGESIMDTVKKCAKAKPAAPAIVVLGLNQVAVNAKKGNFYVSFSQAKVNNNCRKNRGCYYNWNKVGHITLGDFNAKNYKTGSILTDAKVQTLYAEAKKKDSKLLAYKKIGAFCTTPANTPDPPEEYDLIAYAKDKTSGTLLLGGGQIDSATALEGNSATVEAIDLTERGYTFAGWEYPNVAGSSLTIDGSSLTIGNMIQDVNVYALYEPIVRTTTLSVNVKNDSVATYNNFAKNGIYAKPGDTMTFKIEYNPAAQAGCDLKPEAIAIDNGALVNNDEGNQYTIKDLFNANRGTLGAWSNTLNVSGSPESRFTPTVSSLVYGVCDSTTQSNTNSYSVQNQDAGVTFMETAETEKNANGTTPSEVRVGLSGAVITGSVSTGLSDTAEFKVPYNFNTSTNITTEAGANIYAGETTNISFDVNVHERQNTALNDEYATIVRGAKWRIGISTDNGVTYQWGQAKGGDLNKQFVRDDDSDKIVYTLSTRLPIVVPDIDAGSRVCFKSAVYPKDSYDDLNARTNAYDVNDSSSWAESGEACFAVAKRPSLQVWGGNIYSNALISTPLTRKKHLAGYNDPYNASATSANTYVFGSWGELGIIANKSVEGFASGATLGYLNHNDGTTWPNPFIDHNVNSNYNNDSRPVGSSRPGGYVGQNDDKKVFCNFVPLTMANENKDCKNGRAGNIGTETAMGGITNDKTTVQSLANALGVSNDEANETVNLESGSNASYYHYNGEMTVKGGTVPIGRTILVHATGNITIDDDIRYGNNDGSYVKLFDVPKLVIFSNEDININCNVKRIDAMLVANTVNTCNSNNINSADNANQLFVYGAVIANTLKANRTYGAATGSNSMVPAEIIDFDPTLYLWKANNDETDDGGDDDPEDKKQNTSLNVDIVYSHELAPRY